jgi:hypothetical protein
MSTWNYTPEHPITLPIASDARLGSTDYLDDQIWELNIGKSEPPALVLQTTFGLRARVCRIFPRFFNDGQVVIDPAKFHRPISIRTYYPNFICLSFKPFSSINVNIEYWVPSSHVVAARTKITNTSHEPHQIQLEWAELLIPSPDGKRMAISANGLITILAGHTANLAPVLYLTGGVKAGNSPYPSLNLSFEIPAYAEQESCWVNASLEDASSSFDLAKELINSNWEAEFARIERINSQRLEIITGIHDWNTAFFLSQTYSRQLIHQSTNKCPAASFVCARNPDQGFSLRGNGSDYNHLWNGQTAFDAYYLTNFLLPASPELIRGILDNFFASQTPQGEIDWKPGLSGQRSQLMATPILSTLSWMYFQYSGNLAYLKTIFNQLLKFYFSWFTQAHDRDNDLIPEWDQAVQTGFEEHPLFSYVHAWSSGIEASTVESPDLIAYLYRDGQSLLSIARLIGEEDSLYQLEQMLVHLREMLDQSWSDESACYQYLDRDSHVKTHGEILAIQNGSGVMEIRHEFQQPIRPMIMIKSKSERTQPVQVYIHGITPTGAHRVDHIPTQSVRWHLGTGFITSEYVYQAIEKIEITGVMPDVPVITRVVDLTGMDQTLLLPLWARIPSQEQANILVNLTILNKKKFLAPFGLRSCINNQEEMMLPDEYFAMHLPWISLILEGMVNYGLQKKAAEVFSRWMKALISSQKLELCFPQSYHSENGTALGGVNTLSGLVPVGLFLKILGINIINPFKLEVMHANPFPWPVTLKYRGLTVVQHDKKTMVIFPDGQSVSVENNHPQLISIEPK